jgi:hypothetical protein
MEALFAAETPLQLLNDIVFFQANKDRLGIDVADLVIYDKKRFETEIIDRVKESSLFRKVTCLMDYHRMDEQMQAVRATYRRIIHNKKYRGNLPAFFKNKQFEYQYLIGGVTTLFFVDLKDICSSDVKTILIEEGEGTYLGNCVKSASLPDDSILVKSKSFGRRILANSLRIMSKDKLNLHVVEISVYRPDLLRSDIYRSDIKITPLLNGRLWDDLDLKVFSLKDNKKISHIDEPIILALPLMDLFGDSRASYVNVLTHLSTVLMNKAIYRTHPRGRMDAGEIGLNFITDDNSKQSWEILCLNNCITSNNILLGFGSTAQGNPKKIFGKEPYNIFLHRFLPESSLKKNAEASFNALRGLYSDGHRIVAPKSFYELDEVLVRFMEESSERQIHVEASLD